MPRGNKKVKTMSSNENESNSSSENSTIEEDIQEPESTERGKKRKKTQSKKEKHSCSCSTVLQMFEEMKRQNQEISDQLKKLDKKTDPIKNIESSIEQLQNEVKNTNVELSNHQSIIEQLQDGQEVTNNKITGLTNQKNQIDLEQRRMNFIISGLAEDSNEDSNSLEQKVQNIIFQVTNENIEIDTVNRMGMFNQYTTRKIHVRLTKIKDRNLVLQNKKKTPRGIFINPDLPKDILKAEALVRIKGRELKAATGKEVSLNYRKLIVETDTEIHTLQDNFTFISKAKTQPGPQNGNVSQSPFLGGTNH